MFVLQKGPNGNILLLIVIFLVRWQNATDTVLNGIALLVLFMFSQLSNLSFFFFNSNLKFKLKKLNTKTLMSLGCLGSRNMK